jgi:DNA-directed RNA polymerase subunit omega
MRDDLLKKANELVGDPAVLVNIISKRVKQLKFGAAPMVESLEKLEPEDIALRELLEGKLTYEIEDIEKVEK